jgi:hypothetical protein
VYNIIRSLSEGDRRQVKQHRGLRDFLLSPASSMKTVAYALAIFVIRLQSIQSFSSRAEPGCSICLNMASNSELDQISKQKQPCSRKSKRLYSFEEARKIARGHGFSSRQEFIDYDCAGAYQLPKDADLVWKDDWRGWDDFLGVPLSFEEVSPFTQLQNQHPT